MTQSPSFDHHPDPELGAALHAALEPQDDHSAFVARVMAQSDHALERSSVATLDILASWFKPGMVAAAALLVGFLFGRAILGRATAESIDTALAPLEGPGLAALVMSADP